MALPHLKAGGKFKPLATTWSKRISAYPELSTAIEQGFTEVEIAHWAGIHAPAGVPDSFQDHMRLMFDIQVLALQADLTRSITLIAGVDQENRTHPESGTNQSWHGASHHGNVPTAILDYNLINTYRLGKQAYFLEKLRNTMEGDKNLLDKSVVVWGSSMGDPNLHNHRRCPLLLMGKGNGLLEGNLHLRAPQGTPMANVMLSVLQGMGHDINRFGDSTGAFPLSLPRGA